MLKPASTSIHDGALNTARMTRLTIITSKNTQFEHARSNMPMGIDPHTTIRMAWHLTCQLLGHGKPRLAELLGKRQCVLVVVSKPTCRIHVVVKRGQELDHPRPVAALKLKLLAVVVLEDVLLTSDDN